MLHANLVGASKAGLVRISRLDYYCLSLQRYSVALGQLEAPLSSHCCLHFCFFFSTPWWLLMFCYFFPQAIALQWKSLANGFEHAMLATVHAKFDWDIWLPYGSPLVDLACFIAQIKFLWTKAGGCQRWCGCHMKWLCCWICGRKWENPVKTNSLYSLSSHLEVPLEKSPKGVLGLCSCPPIWATRRIDQIEQVSCLESPKPSTSSAPPFKQPLDSNRKSPTVFSSKHKPTTAAAPRFPDYSRMDPCHKLGITRHLEPFAEHHYPCFVFLFTTCIFWQTSILIPSVAQKS